MLGALFVTQEFKLKKIFTRDLKKESLSELWKTISSGALEKDHTRDSKNGSHTGLEKKFTLGNLEKDHTQNFFDLALDL